MRPGPLWEKKDKNRDETKPEEATFGSQWDHVLLDPDSKLVVSFLIGRRTTASAVAVFQDFYQRTDGHLPPLIATDEYAVYLSVIISTYGVPKVDLDLTEADRREFRWDELPAVLFPEEIAYVTVHKERAKGRVTKVEQRIVLGTQEQVEAALQHGTSAASINTSYVERVNGTHRHQAARKARKTYRFSKELVFHVAVTCLCVTWYNFGWTVRTLRVKVQETPPRYVQRTPAMVAGLSEEPMTMKELLTYPVYPARRQILEGFCPDLTMRPPEG
jgi:hypothetical protein